MGLLAAGLVTYSLIRNPLPLPAHASPAADVTVTPIAALLSAAGQSRSPASGTEVVPPGSLVYARSGILFVQTGAGTVQITTPVSDSQASDPAWSADGRWIYYIDTRQTDGWWYNPNSFGLDYYRLTYPVLCRVHPDGSGRMDVKSGIIEKDNHRTFFWMRYPSISPDGSTVAMISDGPTSPGFSDTVLSFMNLGTGVFENTPELEDVHPFGHGDPAYSPDGKLVAYVEEARNGSQGDPTIWLYDIAKRTARSLARGYRSPSWSPDGKFLVAVKSGLGKLNIAVLDASTGKPIGQITSDGLSWSPVWSPAGDTLLYMHLEGSTTTLRMVRISVSSDHLSFLSVPNLIDYSGLDPGSAVAWYIPAPSGASPSPTGANR